MTSPDLRQSTDGGDGAATSLTSELGADSAVTTPEEYAATFTMSVRSADAGRLRSAQTDGGLLGASDAGGCEAKAVYTVKRTAPTDVVKKGKALIGTALHEVWLPQMRALNPDLIVESELLLTLPSGAQIPVHPDLIDPLEPSVTDLKSVGDLALRRRQGPEDRHWMQTSLYFLAALQNGLVTSDDGLIRLLYVNMTDADDVYVAQRPFSMDLVHEADAWFAGVRYAVEHGEHGARDGQPHFCASYCPFVSACKPPLTDASGHLSNSGLIDLAHVAREARELRKGYELVEKQAITQLRGVSGTVPGPDGFMVVSTTVNREGGSYERVEFR